MQYLGVDPLQAGNVVQLVLVLGLTLGWISTYIFRVSNKEMTYAQQLRDYEDKVMQVRITMNLFIFLFEYFLYLNILQFSILLGKNQLEYFLLSSISTLFFFYSFLFIYYTYEILHPKPCEWFWVLKQWNGITSSYIDIMNILQHEPGLSFFRFQLDRNDWRA